MSIFPQIVTNDKVINLNTTITLWFSFFLYWLCNPNLSQTSFWLVGSANYLYPIMWASSYLIYILYILERNIKLNLNKTIFLCILGFLAGLSNEAVGISMVFLNFILFFIYKNQRKTIIISLLVVLFGFLILYFAPGNFERLKHPDFANWRNLPTYMKIINHFFHRIPDAISGFWLAFFIIISSFFSLFILKNKDKPNEKFFIFAFIFWVLSFFSIIVFVKSPAMPLRALNTFNFFIVMTAIFSVYTILSLNDKNKNLLIISLFFILVPYFAISWSRFTYAVIQTDKQYQIREEILYAAKEKGENEAQIPDWYFTKLVKDSDKLNLYRSPEMRQYYGHRKNNLATCKI